MIRGIDECSARKIGYGNGFTEVSQSEAIPSQEDGFEWRKVDGRIPTSGFGARLAKRAGRPFRGFDAIPEKRSEIFGSTNEKP